MFLRQFDNFDPRVSMANQSKLLKLYRTLHCLLLKRIPWSIEICDRKLSNYSNTMSILCSIISCIGLTPFLFKELFIESSNVFPCHPLDSDKKYFLQMGISLRLEMSFRWTFFVCGGWMKNPVTRNSIYCGSINAEISKTLIKSKPFINKLKENLNLKSNLEEQFSLLK